MTPDRYKRIMSVLGNRQPDLTVVADEVHKGRNLAAMVRTCDAVGVGTVYSVQTKAGYCPYKSTTLYCKRRGLIAHRYAKKTAKLSSPSNGIRGLDN